MHAPERVAHEKVRDGLFYAEPLGHDKECGQFQARNLDKWKWATHRSRERAGAGIQKRRVTLVEEQLKLHIQGTAGLKQVEKEEAAQGT